MTAPQMASTRVRQGLSSLHGSVLMAALRVILVYMAALLLQLTIFVEVRVVGVAPELPAMVAVLAGLLAGAQGGSLIAFGAGLMWDIYLPTPLGLAAVSFALVAFGLGSITEDLFHDTRIQTGLLVFAGTAASVAAYAVLGEVVGQRGLVDDDLLQIVLISSAFNAVLSLAVAPAMRWALWGSRSRGPSADSPRANARMGR
jgi:rod shape-determining protein MreD